MKLTATRSAQDWVMVMSTLQAMGWNEPLINRIRNSISPFDLTPITITAELKEAETLGMAIELADKDRPNWWPPVSTIRE